MRWRRSDRTPVAARLLGGSSPGGPRTGVRSGMRLPRTPHHSGTLAGHPTLPPWHPQARRLHCTRAHARAVGPITSARAHFFLVGSSSLSIQVAGLVARRELRHSTASKGIHGERATPEEGKDTNTGECTLRAITLSRVRCTAGPGAPGAGARPTGRSGSARGRPRRSAPRRIPPCLRGSRCLGRCVGGWGWGRHHGWCGEGRGVQSTRA